MFCQLWLCVYIQSIDRTYQNGKLEIKVHLIRLHICNNIILHIVFVLFILNLLIMFFTSLLLRLPVRFDFPSLWLTFWGYIFGPPGNIGIECSRHQVDFTWISILAASFKQHVTIKNKGKNYILIT